MSDPNALYGELKPTLEALAVPLLDFATEQVRKRGAFLPYAATISDTGEVALIAATSANDRVSSADLLPNVIAGLRAAVSDDGIVAGAICEWVKVDVPAGLRDAVKVHVQHRRGLSVAFYMTAHKPILRDWTFGELVVQAVPSLLDDWPGAGAS